MSSWTYIDFRSGEHRRITCHEDRIWSGRETIAYWVCTVTASSERVGYRPISINETLGLSIILVVRRPVVIPSKLAIICSNLVDAQRVSISS